VQGVLYLTDTTEDMGGFQCVPGMHRNLEDWIKTQPRNRNPRVPDLTGRTVKPVPGAADMGPAAPARQRAQHFRPPPHGAVYIHVPGGGRRRSVPPAAYPNVEEPASPTREGISRRSPKVGAAALICCRPQSPRPQTPGARTLDRPRRSPPGFWYSNLNKRLNFLTPGPSNYWSH
jgi:hypothetical protein